VGTVAGRVFGVVDEDGSSTGRFSNALDEQGASSQGTSSYGEKTGGR
jgi:hypothetical protein